MKSYLFALAIYISASAQAQHASYDKTYRIACHNCYDPNLATNIEDVFAYTTTIEIDIWDNFQGSGILSSGNKMHEDWYVKHDVFQKGNVNCCGGSLGDCLKRIKAWGDKHANHEVVTIFIDKKENWSDADESRQPINFDHLVTSIFSKTSIYTPADLLGNKIDLKIAALTNWANMDDLKGKFIFVFTDATEVTSRNPLNEYLESRKNAAVCFVAPQIATEKEIDAPPGITPENSRRFVFYNLDYPSTLAGKIGLLNCLSRTYGSPETIASFRDLVHKQNNFIALDNYRLLQ